jgi:hypothetical protein
MVRNGHFLTSTMAGEIRQPRNIAEVQPPNRTRDGTQRKRPRSAEKQDGKGRQRNRPDAGDHRVDEYV